MENLIIIGILVVLLFFGIYSTRKHFKGESSCCGGKSTATVVPEKTLDTVVAERIVVVDGMTCEHCKGWVEKAINQIDGAAAKVDLKKKEAHVLLASEDISDDMIRAAIKNAGYRVVEIREK